MVQFLALQENLGRLSYFHPANGEVRSARTGAKLNAMGVRSGVPDLVILWYSPFFIAHQCGFIELKSAKGRCSESQNGWADWLLRANFHYTVSRSLYEVEITLKKWGAIP